MCQHSWAELHTHNFLSCVFPASAGQKRDSYRRLGGQKWSSSHSVDHTHCHSSADSPCLCEAAVEPVIASPCQGSSFYFSKSWAMYVCIPGSCRISSSLSTEVTSLLQVSHHPLACACGFPLDLTLSHPSPIFPSQLLSCEL